jgi:SAM-dependent methyltransferase
MARLCRMMAVGKKTRVLDIGGTPEIWQYAPVLPKLVMLNEPRAAPEIARGFEVVFGDALALPFRDHTFDVVFSNSVIEHVGDGRSQAAFAREAARVGRGFWIETPHRGFPVEQHLWFPLVHWLPRSWQQRLLRYRITPWEWLTQPSQDRREFYVDHYLNSVNLLNRRGMRRLFPGASILRERFLGWPKSLISWKQWYE